MAGSRSPDCFIDTNIWLYALIETEAAIKSAKARTLIQESAPVVSTQVVNEVCFNLLRRAHFSETQIKQLVEAFYDKYRVVQLTRSMLLLASDLRQRYSLSFWDSTIVTTALSAGVSLLYSEDMQHGLSIEQLEVRNPFVRR